MRSSSIPSPSGWPGIRREDLAAEATTSHARVCSANARVRVSTSAVSRMGSLGCGVLVGETKPTDAPSAGLRARRKRPSRASYLRSTRNVPFEPFSNSAKDIVLPMVALALGSWGERVGCARRSLVRNGPLVLVAFDRETRGVKQGGSRYVLLTSSLVGICRYRTHTRPALAAQPPTLFGTTR